MAATERLITVVRKAPATVDAARRKAEFDSTMVMLRHHLKYTDTKEDASYKVRQMMVEIAHLADRFRVKVD